MTKLEKITHIPLDRIFKDEHFNDWLSENTDEVKNALKIQEWELEQKNKDNTEFIFADFDNRKKIFVYCDMGRFQEENLLEILAKVDKGYRVVWILERPNDKAISALININMLAGKKFITLMTAQAYKIGDSKPVIEFREH